MMAINMDKIQKDKERLESQGGNGGGSDINWYGMQDGANVGRLCPPKGDSDVPYHTAIVHYNVGPDKKMVVCCKNSNSKNRCPVCEEVEDLKKGDKEDQEIAKEMYGKTKFWANWIPRSGDQKGEITCLSGGKMILEGIINILCDPDYGDISDFEEGHDLSITKKGKNRNTTYTLQAKPKVTVCCEDMDEDELQEALIDLEEIAVEKSYDEILAIMNGEEPEEDESDELEEEKPQKRQNKGGNTTRNKGKQDPEPEDEDEDEDDELQDEIQNAIKAKRRGK